MDLRGLVEEEPTITPSLVLALIENLPPHSTSSALLREVPEAAGWDTHAYLAAALIDSVRDNTFVNMQVRTKKKLEPFERVHVPGVEKQEPKKKKPANLFVQMAQAAWAQSQKE